MTYTNALIHGTELVLFYNHINDVYKYIYENYNINPHHVVIENTSRNPYYLQSNKAYVEGYYLIVNEERGYIRYYKKYIKRKSIFGTTYDVDIIDKWILVTLPPQ